MFLLVSAFLGLTATTPEKSAQESGLLARGWVPYDHLDCSPLVSGVFYEVANDSSGAEALFLGPGKLLISHLPLPEPPYHCRKIQQPHFIEEIP